MSYSEHRYALTLPGGTTVPIEAGRLTLDDSWAPWVQADVTIPTPAASVLAALDPRTTPVVSLELVRRTAPAANLLEDFSTVYAGRTLAALSTDYAGGTLATVSAAAGRTAWNAPYLEPSSRRLTLGVRRRVIRPDGTTALTLASSEALLQDLHPLSMAQTMYQATTLRELLSLVFAEIMIYTGRTFELVAGDDDVVLPAGTDATAPTLRRQLLLPSQTYWDFLKPHVDLANLRLWADPDGRFRLTARAGSDPLTPAVFDSSHVLDSSDTVDRDSDLWADAVVLEYLPNPLDAAAVRVSVSAVAAPTKTYYEKVNALPPFTQFGEPGRAADRVLQRMIRRGRVVPLELVSDYSVAPRRPASVTVPTGPAAAGVVQAVTFDLETDRMTVTTRDLEGTL